LSYDKIETFEKKFKRISNSEFMEEERSYAKRIKQVDNTNAVVLRIPGGLLNPQDLVKVGEVASKYNAIVKLTGAQRMAVVGVKDVDIESFMREIPFEPAAATGPRVRSIKSCLGSEFCRIGQQETIELALEVEKKYHGIKLPSKLKIGVCGCDRSCSEVYVKDIGFMGTEKGFICFVGGSAGKNPRISVKLTENLSPEKCLELTDKIIKVYAEKGFKGKRLGDFIESVGGIEEFRKLVLFE